MKNNTKSQKKKSKIFNPKLKEKCGVFGISNISNASTLKMFSKLNCPLLGVYGNNDRMEVGLEETCDEFGFDFNQPPFFLDIGKRKIAIFHEPDVIDDYIIENQDLDLQQFF